MRERNLWMILAIASLTLFAIPWTLSMFAGQHTFYDVCEMNSKCSKCHADVWSQLDGSQTVIAHKNAANNNNYTTYMSVGGIEYNGSVIYTMDFVDGVHGSGDVAYLWDRNSGKWEKAIWEDASFNPTGELELVSLDIDSSGSVSTDELCNFCHDTLLFGLSGTHTRRTVRVCDDDRCHGNRNHNYNDPDFFDAGSKATIVGSDLSEYAHAALYLSGCNESSPHAAGLPFGHAAGNVNGADISKGYWACLGCHSDAGVAITFEAAETYGHDVDEETPTRYR